MNLPPPNEITAANAGKRFGFAGKARVGTRPRPAWLSSGVRRISHYEHFGQIVGGWSNRVRYGCGGHGIDRTATGESH